MIGLGTIVNTISVIIGGFVGLKSKTLISESAQKSIITALGLSIMFIGISGAISGMLYITNNKIETQAAMMLTVSLVVGTIIGEVLGINKNIERFGTYLKIKTRNEKDSYFIEAFIISTVTTCIGAMAIVGSIQDGISGDHSILFTKSILDFIFVMMIAATLGKGAIFSAIPIFILQGSLTLLSSFLVPILTTDAINSISLVGSTLIFAAGSNMVFGTDIKVANMLPSLIIAVIYSFLPIGL